jgi:tetratricopeptide (TPR) repeat protein
MGRYEESIADFMKSLEKDPHNAITFTNIGLVFRKIEKFDKAVEYFTKEIEINGKESKSYSSRAYCYVRMSMYE